MKLRTKVSLVVLTIIVVVLVFSGNDDPSSDDIAIRDGQVNSPTTGAVQNGRAVQTWPSRRNGFDFGAPGAGVEMTNRSHWPSQYRFRPLDGNARYDELPSAAPPRLNQSYGDLRPGGSGGAGADMFQRAQGMNYRFRPLGEEAGVPKRYEPYVLGPRSDATIPYGTGGYLQASPGMDGMVDAPDASGYQFRPLDEERQSRRWRGNYRRMSVSPAQLASPDGGVQESRNPT
jgi:hypothetical protein